MIYRGGPFDGMDFRTRYDDLQVIALPYPPANGLVPPQAVEYYRLSRGQRVHERSAPYEVPRSSDCAPLVGST
jgi:hypothetical protein